MGGFTLGARSVDVVECANLRELLPVVPAISFPEG